MNKGGKLINRWCACTVLVDKCVHKIGNHHQEMYKPHTITSINYKQNNIHNDNNDVTISVSYVTIIIHVCIKQISPPPIINSIRTRQECMNIINSACHIRYIISKISKQGNILLE